MDLSRTIAPRSDQLNYDDLIAGDMTITISEVREGTSEQPVELHSVEAPGRPYKPSKSMRRVLVRGWGPNGQSYVGKRLTLYGDPTVKWAGKPVGGIRIRAMSDLSEEVTTELTVARGKPREPFTVQPLTEEAPAPAEPSITPEVWSRIQEAARAAGVEQPGPWASEQLGRALSGPQEITEAEGARLLAALQGEEGA